MLDERQQRRAVDRPAHLPGEQREHERQRVVDGVPRVEHAAQQQDQREREQRVALGERPCPASGGQTGHRPSVAGAASHSAAVSARPDRRISGWLIVPVQAGAVR